MEDIGSHYPLRLVLVRGTVRMFLSPPGHSEQEGVAVGRNQNGFAEPVAGWRHALATRVAQGVEGKIDRRARREWLRVLKVSDARYDGETVIEPVRVLSL